MRLLGAKRPGAVAGSDRLPGRVNYFVGSDPKHWRPDVPTYGRVRYQAVYPGIDLIYYGNQGQLEYDFVVAPGADPKLIRLGFDGLERVRIDEAGDLVLETGAGQVRQARPVVYQTIDGSRKTLEGRYVLKDGAVSFALAAYDPKETLVIDPVLSYSTYLGGSGPDEGRAIAVDSLGNVYVAGNNRGGGFPVTAGAFQTSVGPNDAPVFVSKFDANGALVYSTYLGGSSSFGSSGTSANAVAVDSSGNASVTGSTGSTSFPITPGAFQTTYGGGSLDAFVTKLNASGSALLYSTYLGTPDRDLGTGIALDTGGNAYVAATTDGTPGNLSDILVVKLNPAGSALVYDAVFGGTSDDRSTAIALDTAGNAYVTGSTFSSDFPTTQDALQPASGDSCSIGGFTCGDAFVSKINAAGNALLYSTYLGGSGGERGNGITLDSAGNIHLAGGTNSGETNFRPFPITPGALQTTYGGGIFDAFVARLNPNGALAYSTFLGGSREDQATGIAIGPSGHPYATGFTQSFNFPTANPVQATKGDSETFLFDAFVTKLDPGGAALVYSTYLGGSGDDSGADVVTDASGTAYVTGETNSPNFPTRNAFQPVRGGGALVDDAFVAKITDPVPATDADLSVSLADAPNPVRVGANLGYTATVSNHGPAAASRVTLTDSLPNGVTLVSASGCSGTGTLSCNLGSLASGASAAVTITVKPNAAGAIGNSVQVSASQSDPNAANNTATAATTVQASADLRVTATDSPDPVTVGQNLSYKATVTNKGPSTASASKLTDTLPTSLTFVSAKTTKGSCSRSGRTVTCNLGSLAKDAKAAVTIVVKPKTKGTISNTIKVASGVADPVSSNNTAKPSTTVQ